MNKLRRFMALVAAALAVTGVAVPRAQAQGITTGALRGTVTDSTGRPVEGVQIRATSKATGYTAGGITRANGTYFIQGLEVGVYTVMARRIGFEPRTQDNVPVALSQTAVADFRLTQAIAQLAGVRVTSTKTAAETFAPSNTGTKAVVSDTAIQRLPTLTRNLTDFIKLTPQVSASGPGYSAGGMSNRMNNVQIDGSTERDVFGLGSTGQPGAQVNAKSVSLEAVKEFQVILAPFDVRQGNFGGLLLNAVTKSGTNQFTGTAFYTYRDQDFSKDTSITRSTPFDRAQYGFALGGPIIKDKLHFFITPEFQKENSPFPGAFAGQAADITPPFGLSDATKTRVEQLLSGIGLTDPGTAGFVNQANPLSNFFGRVDWRLNDTHRAVFRLNYSNAESPRSQNGRSANSIVYTSQFHDFSSQKVAPVFQLYSNFGNGTFNEFFAGYNRVRDRRDPRSQFAQIRVNNVPLVTAANGTVWAGADQFSQGNEVDMDTYEITDNFTIPKGTHTFTFGTRNELVKVRNLFTQSSYGVWTFNGLDSLAAGNANGFRKALILSQGGNVYFDQIQSALYAQDQWQATPKFALTYGLRADIVNFPKEIQENPQILAAYGRSTADFPKTRLQWSPRVGFNWDVTGNQMNQVRGGMGLFVGPPAGVWLANSYANSGNIITFLNCGAGQGNAAQGAPAFTTNIGTINNCRTGTATKPIGDVNLVQKDLKFPQPFRATLAFDRQLPWDLVATVEGLYSRTFNQLFFTNINLEGARGTDKFGRVLFADTIRTNGVAVPVVPAGVRANGGVGIFTTAIDLGNQNKDYAWNVTTQVRKRYSNNWEGLVAYTYGRAQDVASFTSSTHISNWQFGRTLSTNQFDPMLATSLFDQRHKILANVTWTLNWLKKASTDFTLFYQGTSGAPHDYIYGTGTGQGDLNGDGRQGNDLIYVPTRSTDATQIQFRDITQTSGGVTTVRLSAAQQAANLDNYIDSSPCLSKYRGKILERNVCRLPFLNRADLAIRQNLSYFGSQRASIQLDVFNFSNLLNKNWGKEQVSPRSSNSNIPLLTHAGQSSADPKVAVPIVQFDNIQNNAEYINGAFVANFWRTQLSFRLSF